MIRRALITRSPLVGVAAVIVSKDETQAVVKNGNRIICKPSQLSIAEPLFESEPKDAQNQHHEPSEIKVIIQDFTRSVRMEVEKLAMVVEKFEKAETMLGDHVNDFQRLREYLSDDGHPLARAGAIAVSSVAGMILGIRGGLIKKLMYASITGGAMTALCYPREAGIYAKVAYNFAYGVKPGDEKSEIPKFPATFEALVSAAYEAVVKHVQ